MRKIFLKCLPVMGLLALGMQSTAQVKLEEFKNMKARNIGPAGMSGRVTAIDAIHSNPEIFFVGGASAGVWKTENGGATWSALFDGQPILNIGSIKVQQSNPSVIWVGTGEGNPRNSLNLGEGIYKTLDGGKSWKRMGLEKTRNIHRILIDPTNPNTVYAAAIGNPYGIHSERGVYKTTNGGETWERILYTNDTSGCAELVMDPSNPNKIIANMWQHQRKAWNFNSGGPGSGLYITVDGGKNWKKLGKEDGMPAGPMGRCGMAFAASHPNIVYAKVEATKNGFYKSEDGGFTWKLVNSDPAQITDRPFYYQEIYVDPKNENRIYDIHSTVTYSEDGGKSFQTMIPYNGIHPDHHAWWIHPTNENLIIEGNDGGIGISKDRGKTWRFDEQLPFGQFYHINVDNEIPYNVMGGLQDNGSWRGPAYTWIDGGIRNYYWESLWGGDGFDVVPDPADSKWVYAMSQGGSVGRYNVATGQTEFVRPPAPEARKKMRFNWNSGIALDPFDANTVYFGSQFLHKSTDKGTTWSIISPDLTTNNPEQQKEETGGLTLDITGAENFNTIMAIAPSAKNKEVVWVGTDDGNVQLTRDGGKTWTNFRGKIPGMNVGAWITQIQASRYNEAEAFVVSNDYRRGDFAITIFRTKDFGKTWENILANKGLKGYALCMIQDPAEPNLIFVGTEHGLWVSLDNAKTFQQWKNDYPSVSTYDLTIQEREADLVIATFGRAVWVLDDIRPLRAAAKANGAAQTTKLKVIEAPTAYQANFRNAPGYEWSTWGLFEGENRRRGAMLSFFVNHAADTSKAKADSAVVKFYDDAGKQLRTLKIKADSGLNRFYWNFDTKGNRFPGSPKPRPGANEQGGGWQVYPGTYKMVITLGKFSDSTMVTVKDDPRIPQPRAIYDAKKKMFDRLQVSADKLTAAVDKIVDAEETLTKMEGQLRGAEGKDVDSLRKETTKMREEIKKIRESIFGRNASDRQGITRYADITTQSILGAARQEIGGKIAAPTAQTERLVADAETAITESVNRINEFVTGKWAAYRKLAESTPVKLFKD
ncbi:MAG: VPS10 domain-containing protein [Lacibacter sp.]